jgi:Flp pilus assembly protein TadD
MKPSSILTGALSTFLALQCLAEEKMLAPGEEAWKRAAATYGEAEVGLKSGSLKVAEASFALARQQFASLAASQPGYETSSVRFRIAQCDERLADVRRALAAQDNNLDRGGLLTELAKVKAERDKYSKAMMVAYESSQRMQREMDQQKLFLGQAQREASLKTIEKNRIEELVLQVDSLRRDLEAREVDIAKMRKEDSRDNLKDEREKIAARLVELDKQSQQFRQVEAELKRNVAASQERTKAAEADNVEQRRVATLLRQDSATSDKKLAELKKSAEQSRDQMEKARDLADDLKRRLDAAEKRVIEGDKRIADRDLKSPDAGIKERLILEQALDKAKAEAGDARSLAEQARINAGRAQAEAENARKETQTALDFAARAKLGNDSLRKRAQKAEADFGSMQSQTLALQESSKLADKRREEAEKNLAEHQAQSKREIAELKQSGARPATAPEEVERLKKELASAQSAVELSKRAATGEDALVARYVKTRDELAELKVRFEEVRQSGAGYAASGVHSAVKDEAVVRRVRELIVQAQKADQDAQPQAALAFLAQAVQADPDSYAALLRLGVAYLNAGQTSEAARHLKKAFYLNPDDPQMLLALGSALIDANETELAISCLARCSALQPKLADAHLNLGVAFQGLGWREAATREMERAHQLDPKSAQAAFNLASLYATEKPPRLDEAARIYRSALDNGAPHDPSLDAILNLEPK